MLFHELCLNTILSISLFTFLGNIKCNVCCCWQYNMFDIYPSIRLHSEFWMKYIWVFKTSNQSMVWTWWHQSEAKKMKSRVNLLSLSLSHLVFSFLPLSHSSPNFFSFYLHFKVNFVSISRNVFLSHSSLLLSSSSSSSLSFPWKPCHASRTISQQIFPSPFWLSWLKKRRGERESSFQSRWWWDNNLIHWWMGSIQSMTTPPSVIKQHN